jgi:hypothetical protein
MSKTNIKTRRSRQGRVAVRKVDVLNQKDVIGFSKLPLARFPAVAIAHGSHAMHWGANYAGPNGTGYGPYNWRDAKVRASIYVDAAMRHLLAWYEGEDLATDSGVHHLGHLIAGMAIVMDAEANGTLVDDRPVHGKPDLASRTFKALADQLASRSLP